MTEPHRTAAFISCLLSSASSFASIRLPTTTTRLLQEVAMPPQLTQVARVSDGLPLVATMTPSPGVSMGSQQQQEAKEVLRSLTHGSPTRMSIVSGNNVFYYMTRDTLCFLCLCESSYPKRTAFLYLEEIADLVFSELTKEYGTNEWRTHVDTTSRPFSLIHYDPLIQRKQREFRNPKEVDATHANDSRLHEDLSEIQNIMRSNIDEMLNRGEKLDHVASVSSELQQKSKTFKWGAKKLTWQARLQQYGPMAAGGLFVCMVLYFKFFF